MFRVGKWTPPECVCLNFCWNSGLFACSVCCCSCVVVRVCVWGVNVCRVGMWRVRVHASLFMCTCVCERMRVLLREWVCGCGFWISGCKNWHKLALARRLALQSSTVSTSSATRIIICQCVGLCRHNRTRFPTRGNQQQSAAPEGRERGKEKVERRERKRKRKRGRGGG